MEREIEQRDQQRQLGFHIISIAYITKSYKRIYNKI